MRTWFLGTPLPDVLAAESRTVVEHLRSDAPDDAKSERAFALIYAIGEESLRYHFQAPLERLGVGGVTRRAVDVALTVALKGLRGPMRRVLSGMDADQLRGVADEIEHRLYPDPHADR